MSVTTRRAAKHQRSERVKCDFWRSKVPGDGGAPADGGRLSLGGSDLGSVAVIQNDNGNRSADKPLTQPLSPEYRGEGSQEACGIFDNAGVNYCRLCRSDWQAA